MDKFDLKDDGYDNEGVLTVLEYHGNKVKPASTSKRTFNNVYVKNFSKDPEFTDEQLAELFKPYGEVQSATVMRDQNGMSKGFGFVYFSKSDDAEKATVEIKAKASEQMEDKETLKLFATEAMKKSDRVQLLTLNNFKYKKSIMYFSLFVKNFPPGTTEDELRIYF